MNILLIADPGYIANPFGKYLAEILRTEGLHYFDEIPLEALGPDTLKNRPAVVLAEARLSDAHIKIVLGYVREGGRLLACRPDRALLKVLGIGVQGACAEGYWRMAPEIRKMIAPGSESIQFHGEADLYDLPAGQEARIFAQIAEASGQAGKYPAAFGIREGRGAITALAFDPARSVACLRQGNPEWAGSPGMVMGGSSTNTLRPHDLFIRTDGRKWNDPVLCAIPQADITQRFLAEMIVSMLDFPAPRLWYLPGGAKTVVSILADCDGADGEQIACQAMTATANGARVSFFMIDHAIENATPVTVELLRKIGHEAAIHPSYRTEGDTSNPNRDGMKRTIAKIIEKFEKKFGFRPRTSRNHSATWLGWVEQARIEREFGIRLNSMHGHRPVMGTTLWGAGPAGYICGTGQPQKFVDEKGEVLDIFNAPVHMTDETLRTYISPEPGKLLSSPYNEADQWAAERPNVAMAGLSAEQAFEEIRKMVSASQSGWHAFLLYHWHPITLHISARARRWFGDYVLPYFRKMGIPVWTTEMILDFVDARNGAQFENMAWHDRTLAFKVSSGRPRNDLAVIIPADFNGLTIADVVVNGRPADNLWMDSALGRSVMMLVLPASPADVEVQYKGRDLKC